jgi:hypothetical protein
MKGIYAEVDTTLVEIFSEWSTEWDEFPVLNRKMLKPLLDVAFVTLYKAEPKQGKGKGKIKGYVWKKLALRNWKDEDPKDYKIRNAKTRTRVRNALYYMALERNKLFVTPSPSNVMTILPAAEILSTATDLLWNKTTETADEDTIYLQKEPLHLTQEALSELIHYRNSIVKEDWIHVDTREGYKWPPSGRRYPALKDFMGKFNDEEYDMMEDADENTSVWTKDYILPPGSHFILVGNCYPGDHPLVLKCLRDNIDIHSLSKDFFIIPNPLYVLSNVRNDGLENNNMAWVLFGDREHLGVAANKTFIFGKFYVYYYLNCCVDNDINTRNTR